MFDSNLNRAELTVIRKNDGDMQKKRIIFWLLWICIPIAFFVLMSVLGLFMLALILCVAGLVVLGPFFKFTKRKILVTYEYLIASGDFTVSVINGEIEDEASLEKKTEWVSFKVSTAELIAPYRDNYKDQAEEAGATVTYMAASSFVDPSPDLYFAIFENSFGQKSIMYFEPSEKMLKILKRLNEENTVVVDVSR